MSNTAKIVWKSIGISFMAALMVAAVVWGYLMTPTSVPCASLTYIIEDRAERMYLSESELDRLLQSENIYPVGRSLDLISLHRIESAISHHPMVRTAECYLTPRNEMKVRLTQRVPLLKVQLSGETYYIDTDRRVMQARSSVRDSVLLVTGVVGVQIASGQLADFAEWLQRNKYWRTNIHHIQVKSPQMIYLYLRGMSGTRIVLGSMSGYEGKLAKLRTFLENSSEITPGQNYIEYDVRFRGQVIGRR